MPSSSGSNPTWRSAVTRPSSASSRRSWPITPFESASAPSSCSPSTAPGARPRRLPPIARPAIDWLASWASSPALSYRSSNGGSSRRIRRSTSTSHRPPARARSWSCRAATRRSKRSSALPSPSPDSLLTQGTVDDDIATLFSQAACDIALVAGCNRDIEAGGEGAVLVPFAGHEHDWAAVELGAWLARGRELPLRLLGTHADPTTGRRDASRLLASASLALQRGLGVTAEPVLVPPGANGIVEAAGDAAVVVIGLSERWPHEGIGATRLAVARDARPPVLLVRRGVRPGGLAPPEARTRFTWSAA